MDLIPSQKRPLGDPFPPPVHGAEAASAAMEEEQQPAAEVPVGHSRFGCTRCGNLSVLQWIRDRFGERICQRCRDQTEEYRLLSKSSCKSNYLLSESDLRNLGYIEKPNPNNARFRDMKLYLTKQVRARALQKWGSLEGIAEEQQRRRRARMRGRRRVGSSRSVLPELEHPSGTLGADDDEEEDGEEADGTRKERKEQLTSAQRLGSFFGIQLRRRGTSVSTKARVPHSLSESLLADHGAPREIPAVSRRGYEPNDEADAASRNHDRLAAAWSAAGWRSVDDDKEENEQEDGGDRRKSTRPGRVPHPSLPPSRLGERPVERMVDDDPVEAVSVARMATSGMASGAASGAASDVARPPAKRRRKETVPTETKTNKKKKMKQGKRPATAVAHEHTFDPALEREGAEEGVRIKVCSMCGMEVTYEVL